MPVRRGGELVPENPGEDINLTRESDGSGVETMDVSCWGLGNSPETSVLALAKN